MLYEVITKIELYYAFEDEKEITSERVHPYLYQGKIISKSDGRETGTWNNLKLYKITFEDLR